MPIEPAKPKRANIEAGGIILAFLFALAAVVIAEAMDQTVRGSRDVRRTLAVAPLAVIPEILDISAIRKQRLKVRLLATCFFFQAEDGIRDLTVTGVQTCALPISLRRGAVRDRQVRAPADRSAEARRGRQGAEGPGLQEHRGRRPHGLAW